MQDVAKQHHKTAAAAAANKIKKALSAFFEGLHAGPEVVPPSVLSAFLERLRAGPACVCAACRKQYSKKQKVGASTPEERGSTALQCLQL
jgi:hypothetical protein